MSHIIYSHTVIKIIIIITGDALEAMNHLPDRYEYLGTTASVAIASPRASKNPPEVPAPGTLIYYTMVGVVM